jgi:hypothetical protein
MVLFLEIGDVIVGIAVLGATSPSGAEVSASQGGLD